MISNFFSVIFKGLAGTGRFTNENARARSFTHEFLTDKNLRTCLSNIFSGSNRDTGRKKKGSPLGIELRPKKMACTRAKNGLYSYLQSFSKFVRTYNRVNAAMHTCVCIYMIYTYVCTYHVICITLTHMHTQWRLTSCRAAEAERCRRTFLHNVKSVYIRRSRGERGKVEQCQQT